MTSSRGLRHRQRYYRLLWLEHGWHWHHGIAWQVHNIWATWDVTWATLVSKLMYASPVWFDFLNEGSRNRCQSVLNRLKRSGYLGDFEGFVELCDRADEGLFRAIVTNHPMWCINCCLQNGLFHTTWDLDPIICSYQQQIIISRKILFIECYILKHLGLTCNVPMKHLGLSPHVWRSMHFDNINPFNGIDEYTRHHTHDVIWFKFEKKLHSKGVKVKYQLIPIVEEIKSLNYDIINYENS